MSIVNRLRFGDTRLSRATLNEAADRIEELEAARGVIAGKAWDKGYACGKLEAIEKLEPVAWRERDADDWLYHSVEYVEAKCLDKSMLEPLYLAPEQDKPSGFANLRAIMADQPYRNSGLSVHEIEVILANKGGFMPDEATVWFREARGRLGIAPEQDK